MVEGINPLVQAAKRRAGGYRTTTNLIAMAYLIAGKLDVASAHRTPEVAELQNPRRGP